MLYFKLSLNIDKTNFVTLTSHIKIVHLNDSLSTVSFV